jgi:hypothetical protein
MPTRRPFLPSPLVAIVGAFVIAPALAGCVTLAGRSAGHVPCTQSEIETSQESVTVEGRSWVATCHGRSYVCSSQKADSTPWFLPTSNTSQQVSCSASDEGSSASSEPWTAPAPITASKAATVEDDEAEGPQTIDHQAAKFELPASFARDFDAPGELYRDDARTYAVRFAVESWSGDVAAWVAERFPDAETRPVSIGGRTLTLVQRIGQKLYVSAVIVVVEGKLYELACSSTDVGAKNIPKTCRRVLDSFRLGA